MRKVEIYLAQKRRNKVIECLKNRIDYAAKKERNVRKQASFHMLKTQRYFPMLTAFNALKRTYMEVYCREELQTRKVRLHQLQRIFKGLK